MFNFDKKIILEFHNIKTLSQSTFGIDNCLKWTKQLMSYVGIQNPSKIITHYFEKKSKEQFTNYTKYFLSLCVFLDYLVL